MPFKYFLWAPVKPVFSPSCCRIPFFFPFYMDEFHVYKHLSIYFAFRWTKFTWCHINFAQIEVQFSIFTYGAIIVGKALLNLFLEGSPFCRFHPFSWRNHWTGNSYFLHFHSYLRKTGGHLLFCFTIGGYIKWVDSMPGAK